MLPALLPSRLDDVPPPCHFPVLCNRADRRAPAKTGTNVFNCLSNRLLPVSPVDFAPNDLETVLAPYLDEMGWVMRGELQLLRSDEVRDRHVFR